jgi:tetratricopeptide (TPR) repeat protein
LSEPEPKNELTPLDEIPFAADRVSVRRGRRARRLSVVAVILFTASLWFAEGYLRYDLNETQFIKALTMYNESGRAVLRTVVRQEGQSGQKINAAHLEALASIEEDGFVLTRYQEAYALNPSSWSLVLNFGTRLFAENRYAEARERFREAGVQDAENALPRYLEAAALAISEEQQTDLSEALAIIARTNISESAVRFPEPVWHASMPRRGDWYQHKQTDIVDRCCAPLYRFKNLVEARVRAEGPGNAFEWMNWLETVAEMGRRLVERDEAGGPVHIGQVTAGIQIELDMLSLQRWLATETHRDPDPGLDAREQRLRDALKRLGDFQEERAKRVEEIRSLLVQPLVRFGEACLLFVSLVIGASLVARVLSVRAFGRELPPPGWTFAVPVSAFFLFAATLCFYSLLAAGGGDTASAVLTTLAWYVLSTTGVLAGLFLPLRYLPRADEIRYAMVKDASTPSGWKLRFGTYLNLVQRCWEDQRAALIFAGCAWLILSRIVLGLYPTQLDLLVPGFEEEVKSTVSAIATTLSISGG